MHFSFITLFPSLIEGYLLDSIIGKAIKAEKITYQIINFRDFSQNKHKKVDDYQFSGGAGLLIEVESLARCIDSIKTESSKIIFPLPCAKSFTQNDAKRLSSVEHIIIVCGRYEGFDERIIEKYADEVFSIGDFILTGGELASLCICDSISRYCDGVLGNTQSLKNESFENHLLSPPDFTHPKIWNNIAIPSDYIKGNHNKISILKENFSIYRTKYYRPDMYKKYKTKAENEK